MSAGLEPNQLATRRSDAVCACVIGKGDDSIGVADIERLADQRHAERLVQAVQEHVLTSATPSLSASRSRVMRFALTPMAAARFIVLTMA